MTTLEAMSFIEKQLAAGEVVAAQGTVMHLESERSTLPSSYFERVLRAALEGSCLTAEYRAWCERSYGASTFGYLLRKHTPAKAGPENA
jgi:hypothetical protein